MIPVEDFDLQLNLMLSCFAVLENSADRAIERVRAKVLHLEHDGAARPS